MVRNASAPETTPTARAALVTGGAVRIGRAICLALGRAGFDVAVHYNESRDAAEELVAELEQAGRRAAALAADLTRPSAAAELVERAVAHLGRLDLLVNSAALFCDDSADMTELARMKVLNYDAPAALIQSAEPHLARSSGSVINLADVAAVAEFARYKAYSRTKAALLELTQRKALGLAAVGIRVNAVCPGTVMFPETYSAEQRRRIVDEIPLGRTGDAEDVAQAVVYLARAGFVTGQTLAVDGGRMLRALDDRPASPQDPHLN